MLLLTILRLLPIEFTDGNPSNSGPFYWHGLTLIPARISNYIHYKLWGEITYKSIPKLQQCNRWSLGMDT